MPSQKTQSLWTKDPSPNSDHQSLNTDRRSPILTCQNLSVGYKTKKVLSGLKLAFEPGHFITLLGPNGAGKTTLLRTLSAHLPPLSGSIDFEGRPISQWGAMELAKRMAVVLTEKVSPPLFSVYEFVALGRYPHTDFLGRLDSADREAVQHALAAVHAENLASRTFTDLSDGERQKALVARALAQQPRLLLLDEPTLHLDLKHRVEVMGILRNLCHSDGITVVASLHDVDVAAKVSDRVALIKNGRIISWGPPETVLESHVVADLYDFDGADFDYHLGSIELRGNGDRGRAFVVAGMGSGAVVYRMLAKRGFSIVTGVLHTNDLDCYVAQSLGAECMVQNAMETIDDQILDKASSRLPDCDVVIDCGFPLGRINEGNLRLLQKAVCGDKPVMSLRSNGCPDLFPVDSGKNLVYCNDIIDLLDRLDRREWAMELETKA